MLSQHFMGYGFGAASSPAVARLQRALALLGFAVGDTALALKADGITGPATAAAVNRAMTRYVSTAPASLRTGKLTPLNVSQNASQLSSAIESAAASRSRGGGQMLTSMAPRATAPAAPKPAAKKPAAGASRSQVQAMQIALRNLGSKIGDKTLAIGTDGIVGPKTVSAANKAVSSYGVYSRQVTASDLTNPSILSAIADAANAKASAITKPVPAAPSKPTKSPTVQRLQQAVAALGKKVGDKVLQIGADGLIGPKTAAAVNKVLAGISGAPAQYRTGRLSQAEIVMNAEGLAKIVEAQLAQLGVKPPKLPVVAPPPGLSRSPTIAQIQQSLGQLALLAKDPGLTVGVDGINGPKTTAAVNRAMTKEYYPPPEPEEGPSIPGGPPRKPRVGMAAPWWTQVPAFLRTGKLSIAQVSANAGAIADALALAISVLGATPIEVKEVPPPEPGREDRVPPVDQLPPPPVDRLPPPPVDRLPPPPVDQLPPPPVDQLPPPPVPFKRPTWQYVVGAGVGVAVLGTIGYFAFRGKKSQSGLKGYRAPRRRLR